MKHRGINRMIAILMGAILILGMVPAFSRAENDPQPATPTTIEEGEQNDPTVSPAPATSTNLEVDVDALYEALMACQTWEEARAVMGEYSEEEWDYFRAELDPRKVELLIAHLEELQNGSNTPAVNFTDAAPFLPPVTGVTRARFFAAPAQAKGTDTPGVETLKTATYNPDTGDYTIRLESWVTGAQTTTETTVPTDIVLVLDQSGSMSENMVAGYNAVIGGSYTHGNKTYYGFNDYNSNYYIKLSDGSYQRVSYDDDDNKNFDYYRYLNSSYNWVYVYPRLADGTTNATRQYNYQVVQFYSAETITRLEALQSAVTDFCDAVAEKAAGADGELSTTTDNVNHRIAIVGFASSYDYYNSNRYENTELFDGATQTGYGLLSSGDSNYQNAFKDMNTQAGYNSAIASKNALSASGGTFVDLGMDMASEIFKANPLVPGEQRNRVVIVFTDGTPGGTNDGTVNKNAANAAISLSDTIKNKNQGYGATVYTIGIFSGADANSVGNQNAGSTTADYANWFMQNLSSNNGTPQTPSYYLSAGDSDALNDIFDAIQQNIGGATTTLDETTVVKDIVSPYFTLPMGTSANNISLYTAECTGKDSNNKLTWGQDAAATGLTPEIDDNTVTVTGFDFSDNWCGPRTSGSTTTYSGKKLVIEFKVNARPGFLGGNNVPTNASASGIYKADDTIVENFVIPTVNVPIPDVTVTVEDKNVYLMGGLTRDELLTVVAPSAVTAKCGEITLDLASAANNFGLEDWQNAFVIITPALTHGESATVPAGGLTGITGDDAFTLTVTVTPTDSVSDTSSGTAATEKTGSDTADINVFKPTLTFKDSQVTLGANEPDYGTTNKVGEVWKHGDTLSTAVTMIGDKPILALTYTPADGAIVNEKIKWEKDIPVKVTVKIGNTDVAVHTTFAHGDCAVEGCTWNETELDGDPAFLLHVKACTLKIIKEGGKAGESYLFTITYTDPWDNNKTVTLHEAIQDSNSKTVVGLPIGSYTVAEQTDWSWRYNDTPGYTESANVTLSETSKEGAVTVTNSGRSNQWLSAEAGAINRWLTTGLEAIKNFFAAQPDGASNNG